MVLQFSTVSEHLIDIMMQVTEWKYTFLVLRYDLHVERWGAVYAHVPCFHKPGHKIISYVVG